MGGQNSNTANICNEFENFILKGSTEMEQLLKGKWNNKNVFFEREKQEMENDGNDLVGREKLILQELEGRILE